VAGKRPPKERETPEQIARAEEIQREIESLRRGQGTGAPKSLRDLLSPPVELYQAAKAKKKATPARKKRSS